MLLRNVYTQPPLEPAKQRKRTKNGAGSSPGTPPNTYPLTPAFPV